MTTEEWRLLHKRFILLVQTGALVADLSRKRIIALQVVSEAMRICEHGFLPEANPEDLAIELIDYLYNDNLENEVSEWINAWITES